MRLRTLQHRTAFAPCLVVYGSGRSCRTLFRVRSLALFIRFEFAFATEELAHVHAVRVLRELFAVRLRIPAFTESLPVLTFLPMLYGTVRRAARQQPGLPQEDISQQALK